MSDVKELIKQVIDMEFLPFEKAEKMALPILRDHRMEHVNRQDAVELIRRVYRRAYRQGLLDGGVPIGMEMECPTCSAPGRFDPDLGNTEPVFKDSIWFNKMTGLFECTECWNK